MEQLLPIGTVVRAKIDEKTSVTLMIAGYLPKDEKTKKMYDYATVVYPFGMDMQPNISMIDEDSIEEVVFEGYMDEDAAALTRSLPEMLTAFAKALHAEAVKQESEKADERKAENANADECVNPEEEFG